MIGADPSDPLNLCGFNTQLSIEEKQFGYRKVENKGRSNLLAFTLITNCLKLACYHCHFK